MSKQYHERRAMKYEAIASDYAERARLEGGTTYGAYLESRMHEAAQFAAEHRKLAKAEGGN